MVELDTKGVVVGFHEFEQAEEDAVEREGVVVENKEDDADERERHRRHELRGDRDAMVATEGALDEESE